MKKFLTILLTVLLSLGLLSVFSAEKIRAEDQLTNFGIDPQGVVSWDAYPGTEEYDIYLNGEYVQTIYVSEYSQTKFDLYNYLQYNSMEDGFYDVWVNAWKHVSDYSGEWELLASRPRPPVALGTRHVGYVGPTAAVGNSLPMSTTAQPASCPPRTPGIQGLWPGCGFAEPSPPQGLSVTQDDYSNRGNDTFPSVIFYRPEQL